jgi:hypothetical protein
MPRSSQFVACLALIVCTLLAACSAVPTLDALQASQQIGQVAVVSPQAGSVSAEELVDIFKVNAYVDKPTPAQGEMVILIGNLQKNDIILGGIMMEASWPGEAQQRKMPSCTVQVIYQRGVCHIDTKDYAVGESVPITLKFRYNDKTYLGELSFTVR